MPKKKTSAKGQSFLQSAGILSISIVIVKLMGMVYKVSLSNLFEAYGNGIGNGIFNNTYALYDPIFTLATAGFPIAISRMVSKSVEQGRFRDVKKIKRISLPIFFVIGIIFCILMALGGIVFADYIVDSPGTKYSIWVMSPAIFFGCLMAIYRGYYEGLRNMTPTAISEIIEAASKLCLGLVFAKIVETIGVNEYLSSGTLFGYVMENKDAMHEQLVTIMVAAAILGITIGSALGLLYMMIRFKVKGDGITRRELAHSPKSRPASRIVSELARTALPIGLGAIVMSISSFIDSSLVQRRIIDIMNNDPTTLQGIYPDLYRANPELFVMKDGNWSIQTSLFGYYSYSLTLMMIITALTQVFGTSALPTITSAWISKNKMRLKTSIETVLRTTTFVTIPAGLGLSVLSEPIMNLVYSNLSSTGMQIAAPVLQIMGISVIFIATSTPICSMLQGVGRVDMPLKLLSVGMLIKIVVNYTLVGIPEINIKGAAVGSFIGYMFVCIVGLYQLCKETRIVPNFVTILIKPLFSGILSAVAANVSCNLLSSLIPGKAATIIAILLAVIVYVFAMFLMKGITKNDVLKLPKGKKIAKTLEKHRLIR